MGGAGGGLGTGLVAGEKSSGLVVVLLAVAVEGGLRLLVLDETHRVHHVLGFLCEHLLVARLLWLLLDVCSLDAPCHLFVGLKIAALELLHFQHLSHLI